MHQTKAAGVVYAHESHCIGQILIYIIEVVLISFPWLLYDTEDAYFVFILNLLSCHCGQI